MDTKEQDTKERLADFVSTAILMVDIVRFSLRTGDAQATAIRILILMLGLAIPRAHNDESGRIWSPAGDGGALTFWRSIRAAFDTAFELTRLVNLYNRGEFVDKSGEKWLEPDEPFQLRIGLHLGPVIKAKDFDDRDNIWGSGINMASRVLNLAKPGQILASRAFRESIDSIDRTDELEIDNIGTHWAKHHTPIVLFNIRSRTDEIGILCSEAEVWFEALHGPLKQAIESYEIRAKEEIKSGNPFRAGVLAKRILDLDPRNDLVLDIFKTISTKAPGGIAKVQKRFDDFLSPLSADAILHFFKNAEFKVFKKGEKIVKEGDPADSMMIVVSGEIQPTIQGERLSEGISANGSGYLILRESDLIGEMGLFNAREERTATLAAVQKTIVLSIDYSFLKANRISPQSGESSIRQELRKRIWEYYRERTIHNTLNHPLLRKLPDRERARLLESEKTSFLPAHHQEEVDLDLEHAWNSWIFVVNGSVSFSSGNGSGDRLEYQKGDCLGPLRLVMGGQTPFSRVEVAQGTRLVVLDRDLILTLIRSHEKFRNACAAAGLGHRMQAGLLATS